VEKITLRLVSDKPIGTLVRPVQLYKGCIFPHKETENFGFWFNRNQKIKCSWQSFKSSIESYKQFMGAEKNITKQFEELQLGDLNKKDGYLKDTYTGVINSFVYYDNKGYRLCDSVEKQEKLLSKKSRYRDLHIKFLGIRLYHDIDLQKMQGVNEWKYHKQEGFDFLYPSESIVALSHLVKFENIKETQNIVTSRKEYIVISTGYKQSATTIALNSLSNKEVKVLSDTKIRYFDPDVGFITKEVTSSESQTDCESSSF
jgi:hypothetical protein